MERSLSAKRVTTIRKVGWLGVASMLALALLAPSAGVVNALSAAVYTSNADGSIVNANIYASKDDVYLTGGPCPQGGDLPDGDYYFEVVQPAGGGALLSTDAIGLRKFTMSGGFITASSGHVTHVLSCNASAFTIQLMPFGTSSNGEYKLQVATAASVEACAGFGAGLVFPICQQADQKSDNFKAGEQVTPAPTPVITPAPTPVITPAPTFVQSVLAETGTPSVTLPPTDGLGGTAAPADGTWRLALIALAALLASVLVMTPAPAANRRRR
jgi:hypothetical protein